MSRIYFHTPGRQVEVLGAERAYMHSLVHDLAFGMLGRLWEEDRRWLRTVLQEESYDVLGREGWWEKDLRSWFSAGGSSGGGMLVRGAVVPTHELAANTVIAMRSPVLSLLARLEGMCEDHAWVDPRHAAWFADLIDDARDANILREGMGWEQVAELSREVASGLRGPIVTSYSVCDGFPNADVADWQAPACAACGGDGRPNERMKFRDADYDHCTTCGGEGTLSPGWYELPEAERWKLAEAGMKARKYNRQLSPDTQHTGFLSGANLFDLLAERRQARVT